MLAGREMLAGEEMLAGGEMLADGVREDLQLMTSSLFSPLSAGRTRIQPLAVARED